MESLKRGWSFLKQSWQMVVKDKDLIKPSIYTLVAGFIVTLILVVPVGFVTFLIQDSAFGRIIVYIMWAIVIFIQYTVGYVFSAMTVYLIYGYLAEGDGRIDKAWAIVKRDVWDIASLAAASTAVNLFSSAVRGSKGGIRGMIANLIETVWTEASYLILPAMVVENINLKAGVKRATQIIKDNLLLVGISAVGVKAIVGFVSFILGAIGVALGLGVGVGIVSSESGFHGRIDHWGNGWNPGRHTFYFIRHNYKYLYCHGLPHLPVPVGKRCGARPPGGSKR